MLFVIHVIDCSTLHQNCVISRDGPNYPGFILAMVNSEYNVFTVS